MADAASLTGNGNAAALRELAAPARNNYFYGKLLDVMHFQMEQSYFNRKRWLLNRLGLGSGVLCGLEVVLADDGQSIWVRPGVAIDPLGREIIVPAPYCLQDARQPTDDCGHPNGDPISGEGIVTLCLVYHECDTEPVPVMVGDCDTRAECAPSTVRERFRLLVRDGAPESEPGAIDDEQCAAIFPTAEMDDFDHRLAACQTLRGPCPTPSATCVVLATITFPAEQEVSPEIDACTYRTTVYSNSLLWELMTCLAARVDACCRVRILRYVSGDAQQAAPGEQLAEPLVVEVVNGDGNPVPEETVTFRVRSGGGAADPESVETDAAGRAQSAWTLGDVVGLQTLEASIASGSHVLFTATAVQEGGGEPPTLECVDFEDVDLGATFGVGDSFVTSGATVRGQTFFWSNGDATDDGFARIEDNGNAGGSGQDVQVNNINLAFDFGVTLVGLTVQYGEFGGNLNLEVNGDLRNFQDFPDVDGEEIGGVSISVAVDDDGEHGTLTLRGDIESFAIGGQELWIDDICPIVQE